MGLKTKIEYADSTHSFWYGCDKISEGCQNCFAEKIYKRFMGKDFSKIIKSKNFDAPLKWKKPRVILVNDMSDFFHEKVDNLWRWGAIEVFLKSPQHIFLLLTKRPKNMYEFFNSRFIDADLKNVSKNIWLGVSVENQRTADERIPELLKIPHFKKWISFEPLLSMVNASRYLPCNSCNNDGFVEYGTPCSCGGINRGKYIDWIVAGAETGKGARPMQSDWAKNLLNQCKNAGVPFFMKQMTNRKPIPKDLMVREYPKEIGAITNADNKV